MHTSSSTCIQHTTYSCMHNMYYAYVVCMICKMMYNFHRHNIYSSNWSSGHAYSFVNLYPASPLHIKTARARGFRAHQSAQTRTRGGIG